MISKSILTMINFRTCTQQFFLYSDLFFLWIPILYVFNAGSVLHLPPSELYPDSDPIKFQIRIQSQRKIHDKGHFPLKRTLGNLIALYVQEVLITFYIVTYYL